MIIEPSEEGKAAAMENSAVLVSHSENLSSQAVLSSKFQAIERV